MPLDFIPCKADADGQLHILTDQFWNTSFDEMAEYRDRTIIEDVSSGAKYGGSDIRPLYKWQQMAIPLGMMRLSMKEVTSLGDFAIRIGIENYCMFDPKEQQISFLSDWTLECFLSSSYSVTEYTIVSFPGWSSIGIRKEYNSEVKINTDLGLPKNPDAIDHLLDYLSNIGYKRIFIEGRINSAFECWVVENQLISCFSRGSIWGSQEENPSLSYKLFCAYLDISKNNHILIQ